MHYWISCAIGFGLLGCFVTSQAKEREYMTMLYKKNITPSITVRHDHTEVLLPITISDSVRKNFKDYKIPDTKDYHDDWVSGYVNRPVPFLALGDFNYDGKTDVAILLVNRNRRNYWKLVVFHRVNNDYTPMVLTSSPEPSVSTQYGRDYGPVQKYSLLSGKKCSNNKECLELLVSEAASFEYIWENGRYKEVNTSD